MKVCFSICSNPAYDHIRSRHLSVGRNSKTNPARGADVHGEVNGPSCDAVVPVESIELFLIIKQHLLEGIPRAEFDVGACCQ